MGSLSGRSRSGFGAGVVTIGAVRLEDLASDQQPIVFPPAQSMDRMLALLFVLRGAALFRSTLTPAERWLVKAPSALYVGRREEIVAELATGSRVLAVTATLPFRMQQQDGTGPPQVVCPETVSLLLPTLSFFVEVFRRPIAQPDRTSLVTSGACLQVVDNLIKEITAAQEPADSNTDELYQRAARFIESNYSVKGLGPHQIAAALAVSTRQLQRTFQQRGLTVLGMIRQVRVGQARALLLNRYPSIKTLDSVADLVGFSSRRELRRALSRTTST